QGTATSTVRSPLDGSTNSTSAAWLALQKGATTEFAMAADHPPRTSHSAWSFEGTQSAGSVVSKAMRAVSGPGAAARDAETHLSCCPIPGQPLAPQSSDCLQSSSSCATQGPSIDSPGSSL